MPSAAKSLKRGLALAVGALTIAAGLPALAAARDVVPTGPGGDPYWVSASEVGIAWDQDQGARSGWHVYYRAFGERRVSVEKRGWEGASPSLTDGILGMTRRNSIVFQQFRARSEESDLYAYSVDTGRRRLLPDPVSTDQWEYWPVATTDRILFMRCYLARDDTCRRRALLLYNPLRHDPRVIVPDVGRPTLVPGFVGWRYAAWSELSRRSAKIQYYDQDLRVIRRQPVPDGTFGYGPVIDEANGDIYFVQSRPRCGARVTVRKAVLGAQTSSKVLALPRGVDIVPRMSLVTTADGHLDLYYTRVKCTTENTGINVIQSVDQL